jgi:flagellar hook-basal body complex protein FliE
VVQNLERCEFAQDLIMASHLGSELEQESYEPEEFVERLAWRATTASSSGSDDIGSEISNAFIQAIRDLNVMQEKQKKKCLTLEQVKRVDISDVVVFLALLSRLFQKIGDEE